MVRNGLSTVESLVAAVMRVFSGSVTATLQFAYHGGGAVRRLAQSFKTEGVETVGPGTLAFIYSFVTATVVWIPVDISKMFQAGIANYMWYIAGNTNSLLGTFLILGTGLVESLFPILATATMCLLVYEIASVIALRILFSSKIVESDSIEYYCVRYFGVYMLLILYAFITLVFGTVILVDAARSLQPPEGSAGISAAWPLLLVVLFVGATALVIYEVRRFRKTLGSVAADGDADPDAPGPATAGAIMVSVLLLNYGVLWFKTQILAANPQSTRWMEKYVAVTDLKCHYSTDGILSISALISNELPSVERIKPSDAKFIVDILKVDKDFSTQKSLFCPSRTWPEIERNTKSSKSDATNNVVKFENYKLKNNSQYSIETVNSVESKCRAPLYLSDAIYLGPNKIEQKFLEVEPRSIKEYNFLYYKDFLENERKSDNIDIDKFVRENSDKENYALSCIVLNNHKRHIDSFYRHAPPFPFVVAAPLVVNIPVGGDHVQDGERVESSPSVSGAGKFTLIRAWIKDVFGL